MNTDDPLPQAADQAQPHEHEGLQKPERRLGRIDDQPRLREPGQPGEQGEVLSRGSAGELTPALLRALASKAPSRIALWTRLLRTCAVETAAEIGVWRGEFSRQMLRSCPRIRRYFLIDPWARLPDWNKPLNVTQVQFEAVYQEVLSKLAFAADKTRVLRGRTAEVIDQIADASLDAAYIDGDHTLRGITIDLQRVLPKMRRGGLIGGDDFTASPWQHDERYEPTLVCPYAVYFAEAQGLPFFVLPFNQFLIINRPEAGFSLTDLSGGFPRGALSLQTLHRV
jgi:hypothetical protein